MPSQPRYDVMQPHSARPTLGSGGTASVLPRQPSSDEDGPKALGLLGRTNVEEAEAAIKIADALRLQPEGARREILKDMERKLTSERNSVATGLLPALLSGDARIDALLIKYADVFADLPPSEARQVLNMWKDRHGVGELDQALSRMRNTNDALVKMDADLRDWQSGGLHLQRRLNTVAHHLCDTMRDNPKLFGAMWFQIDEAKNSDNPNGLLSWHLYGPEADGHSFVVEHDWGKAFLSANEVDAHEIKLPFDEVCFEFRISDRNVCAIVKEEENRALVLGIFVEGGPAGWIPPRVIYRNTPGGWAQAATTKIEDPIEPLKDIVCDQIRAICISLEAEVSVTDVVRAPYRLNRSRAKRGRSPIADYHVIKLAHRHRVLPRSDADQGEPGARKRLHFRRGHWRHYANHRSWIRWTLVGDPDLGFVDKHYRL